MVFGNFNTFKADVKLSEGKFYYELDIKNIRGIAQFGWAMEGFEKVWLKWATQPSDMSSSTKLHGDM